LDLRGYPKKINREVRNVDYRSVVKSEFNNSNLVGIIIMEYFLEYMD